MKMEKSNILFASIFAFVFLIGFASAISSSVFVITNLNYPSSVYEDESSFTFTFNLTYTGTSDDINISFEDSTTSFGAVSIPTQKSMNGTIDESRIVTGTITGFENQGGNTLNVIINATTGYSIDDETTFSIQINNIEEAETCDVSDNGNLDISIKDVSVEKGYGKDNEWFPLDKIEIEVEVKNSGDDKIKNIEIKWGLYDEDADEWVIDDKESDFNLNDGDRETVMISYTLDDPRDFEDQGNYVFYVWATGEDTELDVDTCVMDSESIDVIIEDDFVILGDLEMLETVSCGGEVQFSADVWNIGEDDQDEVSVILYNKELGLNEQVEIGDINAFDNELLDFTFQIPNNAVEKTYSIKFTVYDEDNKIYKNDYDKDESIYSVFLKVEGSCSVAKASVNAFLESGGEAGKPLVVKATIVNTGDKTSTYLVNAASYAEWASSATLDRSSLTLDAGKSGDVSLTFDVKNDVSGNKLFYLEVLSENELVVNQPVQVDITKKSWGITGSLISGDNKYIWGIGFLNLILVILIIVLAVRISRK